MAMWRCSCYTPISEQPKWKLAIPLRNTLEAAWSLVPKQPNCLRKKIQGRWFFMTGLPWLFWTRLMQPTDMQPQHLSTNCDHLATIAPLTVEHSASAARSIIVHVSTLRLMIPVISTSPPTVCNIMVPVRYLQNGRLKWKCHDGNGGHVGWVGHPSFVVARCHPCATSKALEILGSSMLSVQMSGNFFKPSSAWFYSSSPSSQGSFKNHWSGYPMYAVCCQ